MTLPSVVCYIGLDINEEARMIKDLILQNRSYRRFFQDVAISEETLRELVDLARLSPSAANQQALKYVISGDAEKNARIFPSVVWAAALPDWPGPEEGEKPSAYIIIVEDTEIKQKFGVDHGIVAQSILLGAVEKGLGGCMIGSIRKDVLRQAIDLAPRYEIALLLALGKPKEKVVIEAMRPDGDVRYWRDSDKTHHVPKRALDEIILS